MVLPPMVLSIDVTFKNVFPAVYTKGQTVYEVRGWKCNSIIFHNGLCLWVTAGMQQVFHLDIYDHVSFW